MRFKLLAVAGGIWLASIINMTAASAAQDQTVLNVSIAGSSMSLFQSVPLQLAIEKGFFNREGISIHFIKVGGGTGAVDAAVAGKADIAVSAVTDLATAVSKGAKAVGIAGETENPIYTIVTKPDITDLAQLKGKPVAVSFPTDIITIATQRILRRHGVVGSAYAPRVIIGSAERARCLQEGDCAAAALLQPFDVELESKGYHLLASSNAVLNHLEYTVYAVQPAWAEQHKRVLINFIKAMGYAYRYVADPANKGEVVSIGSRITGTSENVTKMIYNLLLVKNHDVLPKHGEISITGVGNVINLMKRTGQFKSALEARQLVDLEYLKAAGLQ